ncbi:hypothetical protein LAV77_04965 [Priestia megaterium]|uniref:hypothetical protein n=1 Tax=Priestia megaterium TaxID=1404 RepID=UPI002B253B0A|nr:hypothetical protein [Priestia megaterium]MEB2264145.1 hypothetical protein [Priestia megaterium]
MTYEELENYLQYSSKEDQTYLPNEIFNELKVIKNPQHRAFAYSYIYLNNYIWRYAKYGQIPYSKLTQSSLYEILGKKGNKALNYLTKKDGLLEEIKWLETVKDFPIIHEYKKEDDDLQFTFVSEWKEDVELWNQVKPPNKFTVKRPIRSYHRNILDPEWSEDYEENGYEDGTYFEIENTHQVPFEVFIYCMTNQNVGVKGFYLYSYLHSKTQLYGSYDVTMIGLSEQLAIPESTIEAWLDTIRKFNMLEVIHNQEHFILGLKKGERFANTYKTNTYKLFSNKPIEYKKMGVLPRSIYLDKLKKEQEKKEKEELEKYGITISPDQLPF